MLGVPLSCMHKWPGDCDEEGCPRHGWDLRCPQPHSSENAVFLFSSIFFQSLYCCFKTRTQVVTLLNVYGQIAHILILCWLWNYNQYHFFFWERISRYPRGAGWFRTPQLPEDDLNTIIFSSLHRLSVWDCRHAPSRQFYTVLGITPRALHVLDKCFASWNTPLTLMSASWE